MEDLSLIGALLQILSFFKDLLVMLVNIHAWLRLRESIPAALPSIRQKRLADNDIKIWLSNNRFAPSFSHKAAMEDVVKTRERDLEEAEKLCSRQQRASDSVWNCVRWLLYDRFQWEDVTTSLQASDTMSATMYTMMK